MTAHRKHLVIVSGLGLALIGALALWPVQQTRAQSDIEVTPTALDVTGTIGETLTRTLTIRNLGTADLTWNINPPDGRVIRTVGSADAPLYAGAFDGNVFWATVSSPYLVLKKFDAVTGAWLGDLSPQPQRPERAEWNGLDWDGASLWVTEGINRLGGTDRFDSVILALNPATGQIVKTLAAPSDAYGLMGVAVGDGYVWVNGWIGQRPNHLSRIWKLDPASGAVVASWPVPASIKSGYNGVEYLNGAIWIGGYEGEYPPPVYKVYKLNAEDGQVLAAFPMAAFAFDLEQAGSRTMWVFGGGVASLVDIGEEPWMREDPRAGTVPGLASQTVTLTLDTVAAGLGVHESTYRIVANDPDEPEVLVPVKFTVLANPNNHPPVIAEGASVNVTMSENAHPTPFSLTLHATDADQDTLTWRVSTVAAHGNAWANGSGASQPAAYVPTPYYAGTDRFTVEVADGRGGTAAITVNVTIQAVNYPPTVTAVASPMIGTAPLTVAFMATGADPDGDPLSYLWDFGTGNPSDVSDRSDPSFTYTNPGTYAAAVTVTDPGALPAQAPLTITVWAAPGPAWGVPHTWGENDCGQLGDGTTTDRHNPVPVAGLSGVSAVAGFGSHTVALKSDGTVFGWGANSDGQLGDGTTTNRLTPEQASGLAGATAIATGPGHTVALKADGTVWTCGYNYYGQLGDGTTTSRLIPVPVTMADGTPLAGVIAIAAGSSHTVALKADHTVWAWGYNGNGQLGDGTTTPTAPYGKLNPVQAKLVNGTPLAEVVAVAAGYYHSLALNADGSVWAWGYNSDGQLGYGAEQSSTPIQVSGLANVTGIAAGIFHSLAVKSDGSLWAWGNNHDGQLGDGTDGNTYQPVQAQIADVTAVAGGAYHTLAIKADATAWAWGRNSYGQIGDGTSTGHLLPVQVKLPDGTPIANVTAIAAGYYTSMALTGGGVNRPPTIVSPAWAEPATVTLPAGTTVYVVASDPDGDALSYAWSKVSGAGTASFAMPTAADSGVTFSAAGTYVLRVTVADGKGGSVSSDVSVTVNPGSGADPRADVNHDGVVNALDLQIVIANFGKTVGGPGCDARADANADGVVNALDLQIVIANFGQTVP